MADANKFFPLFIDINGKKALVIGGGNVAERRVRILASFGAGVTVISPRVTEYIERAASPSEKSNPVRLLRREYRHGDITAVGPFLIVAATDDRRVNHAVMTEAKRLNIHVSVADNRGECTFYFPAIAENGDYVAGLVSKNGDHAGVKETVQKLRGVINA